MASSLLLRRDECVLLQTALAVLVVQKRLQRRDRERPKEDAEESPSQKKKAKTTALATSLPLIWSNNEDAFSWKGHLQHVLRLLWKAPQHSLCVHIASQLEQVVALAAATTEEEGADPASEPSTAPKVTWTDVMAWFTEQLSYLPSEEEHDSSNDDEDHGTKWCTIWSTIVSLKPEPLSQYLVRTLLDLLLLQRRSTNNVVPKVLYLELLEYIVMQVAPEPVRAWTRRILQWSPPPIDMAHNNRMLLLPAASGSWYSVDDLAPEYTAHAQQHHDDDLGERWLLRHGLASLSERLGGG